MRTGMIAAAALAAVMVGCGQGNGESQQDGGLEGSGVIVRQTRDVPPFHGVRLEDAGRVRIAIAPAQTVEVEADDNVVDRVQTQVVDGILVVGLEPGSYRDVTLTVHVSATAVDRLELEGAGELDADVGDLDTLTVSLDGAGTMTLAGAADRASMALSGAGAIRAYDLLTTRCSVTLEGTGSAQVTVSDHLEAVLSGTGAIRYDGAPTVDRTVIGLGSIAHR